MALNQKLDYFARMSARKRIYGEGSPSQSWFGSLGQKMAVLSMWNLPGAEADAYSDDLTLLLDEVKRNGHGNASSLTLHHPNCASF